MTRTELRIHEAAKHRGEKPFVCEECGHRASSRNGLKMHIKAIHRYCSTSELRRCPVCSVKFVFIADMTGLLCATYVAMHSLRRTISTCTCLCTPVRGLTSVIYVAKPSGHKVRLCSSTCSVSFSRVCYLLYLRIAFGLGIA